MLWRFDATKIEQHALPGKESPVLQSAATAASNIIQPVLMWRPNLVSLSYSSYYCINPQGEASLFFFSVFLFFICRKTLALKVCLIICNECDDMLHLTLSSCCASLPFQADTFTRVRTVSLTKGCA